MTNTQQIKRSMTIIGSDGWVEERQGFDITVDLLTRIKFLFTGRIKFDLKFQTKYQDDGSFDKGFIDEVKGSL